jgi:hypothetical protein
MPVGGIIFPIERKYYGFLERLYVRSNLPTIIELQNAGLSAYGIATALNHQGRKSINGADWDGERVIGVLTRDKDIRREDMIWRAERMPSAS